MPEYTPLPDSLPNATETYHSAVCCRETVAGGDRCIWHADVSGKPRKDFPEVNQDKPVVLDGANLSGADLGEKSLTDVQMRFADLSGVDFEDADLSGSDLLAADLSEADLLNADFLDTDLPSANLSGAHLRDAEFSDADFTDSNLRNAQARGANFNAATLERADLSKANLFGANLTEAELYGAILSDIRLDDNTQFGDHYTDQDDDSKKATWTFRQIEQISRDSALPEQVTEATIQRKKHRRMYYWRQQNVRSWVRNRLFGLLTKHGESPGRVVVFSILTVLAGAAAFPLFGIRDTTNNGQVLTYALQNTDLLNLLGKGLYLSTVTFTTVGYGDLQPVGYGQLLATIESFLGALLMALLVFVLGRRATR